MLLRLIATLNPPLHRADWLDHFLGNLVADFPGNLLAVLSVGVLLSLLDPAPALNFTNLLWFKMAILFLVGNRDQVGELLAVLVSVHVTLLSVNLENLKSGVNLENLKSNKLFLSHASAN